MSNIPLDPLLFYLRDHELYYTALSGPRYNEYAIFIDYHEWELSATCSFYQYLKIIKAYQALLQTITMKPILVILPIGYIETCRWFNIFTYWKDYDPCILQFVQKVIPVVHICPMITFPINCASYNLQPRLSAAFKTRVYKLFTTKLTMKLTAPVKLMHTMTLHVRFSISMVIMRNKLNNGKSLALGKTQSHNEKTLQGTNNPWQK